MRLENCRVSVVLRYGSSVVSLYRTHVTVSTHITGDRSILIYILMDGVDPDGDDCTSVWWDCGSY